MNNKQNGITLIALIITIIVMLILVGVSVTVALNGGLFTTTEESKRRTLNAVGAEQELDNGRIKAEGVWYDSYEDYIEGIPSEVSHFGIIPDGGVYTRVKVPEGAASLSRCVDEIIEGDGVNTFPETLMAGDLYSYGGLVYVYGGRYSNMTGADWSFYYGAILTPVDSDPVWHVVAETGSKTEYKYIISYICNIPVTDMAYCFYNCAVTVAPRIPNTITDMQDAFYCCTALETAPEIPSSVTNMKTTFWGCSNLTGRVVINANPTSYDACFNSLPNRPITLTGSSTILSEIAATSIFGNVSVE